MATMIWNWVINWIWGWGGAGALVSVAAWLLWYFTPAILLNFKSLLLHVAVGATVFTFASSYFFTSGYNKGYAVAINQVAKNTKEAKDAVDTAVKTTADCFARGGTPDDTTGVCDR